jgi:hypothetical protein
MFLLQFLGVHESLASGKQQAAAVSLNVLTYLGQQEVWPMNLIMLPPIWQALKQNVVKTPPQTIQHTV